ncbi:hypothetical protein Tco_1409862 [Tanacetum coccineum]
MKKPSQAPKGVSVGSKVSNSNLFDVLNSVENDMDLGTNGENSNSVDYLSDYVSEDEVASVDNDLARFMALEKIMAKEKGLVLDVKGFNLVTSNAKETSKNT